MIKFNNFPPAQAGDVTFTEAGIAEIRRVTEYNGKYDDTYEVHAGMLQAYGRFIGETVFNATDNNREQTAAIVAPLQQLALEVAEAQSAHQSDFYVGVNEVLLGRHEGVTI